MKNLTAKKTVLILKILYPVWMLIAIFSVMYVPTTLIVSGDPLLTAENIISNEFLFRLGIVGSLFTQILFIFVPLFLYKLFESTSKDKSVLMVLLALVSVPITMYNTVNSIAALELLSDPSLMMHFLNLNSHGIIIVSIFWGLWLFPLGFLVNKSGYFPKIIGGLLIIAGFGYLFGSVTYLLFPDSEILLSIFEAMTFGEMAFIFWLIIKGANIQDIAN